MAVDRKVPKAKLGDVVEEIPAPAAAAAVAVEEVKRPVGRPPKKWLVPFSSKIEIDLRQELDAHLADTGVTIVDFLDAAIRNQILADKKR